MSATATAAAAASESDSARDGAEMLEILCSIGRQQDGRRGGGGGGSGAGSRVGRAEETDDSSSSSSSDSGEEQRSGSGSGSSGKDGDGGGNAGKTDGKALKRVHSEADLPRRWSNIANEEEDLIDFSEKSSPRARATQAASSSHKLSIHRRVSATPSESFGKGEEGPKSVLPVDIVDGTCANDLAELARRYEDDGHVDEGALRKIMDRIDDAAAAISTEGSGNSAGPMGGSNERRDHHPPSSETDESSSTQKPIVDPSAGHKTSTHKLQFMDNDEVISDEGNGGSPRRYRNVRGSLTNLKGNLADRAGLLGGLLKNPNDVVGNNDDDDAPAAERGAADDPPGNANWGRPIQRKASVGDDNDHDTYDLNVPTALGGRGSRPRRTTVDSGMWSAISGTLLRRASNESEGTLQTDGSKENGTVNEDHGNNNNNNHNKHRRGGNEAEPSGHHIDEENQQQPEDGGRTTTTTTALGKVHGSLLNRRASLTPFIDDEGNALHYDPRNSGSGRHYRPGQRTIRRCLCALLLLAVLALGSALVGTYYAPSNDAGVHEAYVPIPPSSEDALLKDEIVDIAEGGRYSPEDLFQMAKSVDDHCHPEQLSTQTGRWECNQICHDHFCCFHSGDDGNDDCRGDESKLCMIFAGCEALALEERVAGPGNPAEANGEAKEVAQQGTATHGGADDKGSIDQEEDADKGTTANSGADDKGSIGQEEDADKDLGWQEIRQKYIDVYCEESNIERKAGRKQCEKVCANHFCCFDTSKEGYNCRDDKSMTCDLYLPCQNLIGDVLDDVEEEYVVPDVAKPEQNPEIYDSEFVVYNEEGIPLPPQMALEFLPPPPGVDPDGVDILRPLPPGEDVPSDAAPGTANGGTVHAQLTMQELINLKGDVKQRCSDYLDPVGRLHCEEICRAAVCCFSDKDGCQTDPSKLCDIYDMCKVLKGTSSLLFKDKDEDSASQLDLISPELEQEMTNEGDGNSDNDTEAFAGQDDDSPNDGGEGNDSSNNNQATDAPEQASIVETPNPTPKPNTSPTLAPLTPPPTSPPVLPPTPPPVAPVQSKPAKLPPPPPIRCIPEGDDEIHTEVYSDDWNDDRYSRCKRWENKHDMTISEYWDLQGIDSELEKNVLENMLIKDNAKVGVGEGENQGSDFDVNPLPPPLDPDSMEPPPREDNLVEESLDDLDDDITEDDQNADDDMLRLNFDDDENRPSADSIEEYDSPAQGALDDAIPDDAIIEDDFEFEDYMFQAEEDEDTYEADGFVNRFRRLLQL